MNREERRKLEKTNSKLSVMQRYRQEAYDLGYKAGQHDVVDITLYMMAYTLTYKTDFTKEQVGELVYAVYDNIDAYRTEHLTPEDYKEIVRMIEEDYKIKIR